MFFYLWATLSEISILYYITKKEAYTHTHTLFTRYTQKYRENHNLAITWPNDVGQK